MPDAATSAVPDAPAPREKPQRDVQAFLQLARDRHAQAATARHDQLQRELDDIAFYNLKQWPDAQIKARSAQPGRNGLPDQPARPCLVFDQTRGPVNNFINQIRGMDLAVEIVPADDFGDLSEPVSEDEITLREGLVRRIQRAPETEDASLWGASRGIIAGQGYWGVMTRDVPGKTRDQEIYVCRFFNQAAVSLDPAHEQPDGSDCDWAFVETDMPWPKYQAEFPKVANRTKDNPLIGLSNNEFRSLGKDYPDWFTDTGETRSALVVDYYWTDREVRTLAILADGTVQYEDELPEGTEVLDTKPDITTTIHWAKIDATQILEETIWPGHYIPIVKYVANELHPDGSQDRQVDGVVRSIRGSAEGFNYMVNKQIETVALSPIPPWQIADGQIEGYEEWWKVANTRTLPFLPYKTVDIQGTPIAPPQRVQTNTGIGDIANSVALFREVIADSSGVHDPSMGKTDPALRSGKSIQLQLAQDQQSSSQYGGNFAKSKRHEGRLINDLLYPVYGTRPGRLTRIVNGEGESEHVTIGAGALSPSGQPPSKAYRLTKDAAFHVNIKVTKKFDTRRDEEAAALGQLIQARPELFGVFGDLWLKNQDIPGHQEMAERAKVMLAPPIQQMIAAKQQGQAPIPPEVQMQLAQIPQLQQALQQAQQVIQTDQAKQQGAKEMKAADLAWAREKLERELAAKIEIARISAAKEAADADKEDAEEAIALGLKQEHEAAQADLQRIHERDMAELTQTHQRAMAAQAAQAKSIAFRRGADGGILGADVTMGPSGTVQ